MAEKFRRHSHLHSPSPGEQVAELRRRHRSRRLPARFRPTGDASCFIMQWLVRLPRSRRFRHLVHPSFFAFLWLSALWLFWLFVHFFWNFCSDSRCRARAVVLDGRFTRLRLRRPARCRRWHAVSRKRCFAGNLACHRGTIGTYRRPRKLAPPR